MPVNAQGELIRYVTEKIEKDFSYKISDDVTIGGGILFDASLFPLLRSYSEKNLHDEIN